MKGALMRVAIAVLAVFCFCLPAAAQTEEQQRFERQLEQFRLESRLQNEKGAPIGQQVLFQYGGYATFDYFSFDDRFKDNHGGTESALIGYARANFYDAQEFFVRAKAEYRTFNPGDSFNGKGDQWVYPVLEIAYYRFDLKNQLARNEGTLIDWDFTFKGGRDLVYWANGLVLSQLLDGGVIDVNAGRFTIEGVGGITPGHTVDFDSSRPYFDNDTHRGFFGGMIQTQFLGQRPFVYGVAERDYNDDIARLNVSGAASPILTHFGYNADYIGAGSTGAVSDQLSYALEIVYEGGNNLSNSFKVSGGSLVGVPQTRDNIHAYAGDLRIDYAVLDPYRTRLSFEALTSSGDSDRLVTNNTFGGNKPHTPDLAFNTLGIVNTGLSFSPGISNITLFRMGASTFPAPQASALRRLQVGADFFVYLKSDARAPIEEPTLNRHFLGVEPDIYLNWRVTSDVTLVARYGAFLPGQSILSTHAVRQFLFTGVSFAF